MRKGFGILISLTGILFGLISCQPEPNSVALVQNMLVQTSRESTANFSSYSTYMLASDTLGYIYSNDPTDTLITGIYAEQVTAHIRNNMDNAGYIRVANNQNPDLAVSVFVVEDFNVFQALPNPGYYGSYSGVYYPKYYGYKHYYGYPTLNTFKFNAGTLVIEIIDLKNKDSQGKSRLLWVGYIGDLLNTVDIFSRTLIAIDESFAQSPYIKR